MSSYQIGIIIIIIIILFYYIFILSFILHGCLSKIPKGKQSILNFLFFHSTELFNFIYEIYILRYLIYINTKFYDKFYWYLIDLFWSFTRLPADNRKCNKKRTNFFFFFFEAAKSTNFL